MKRSKQIPLLAIKTYGLWMAAALAVLWISGCAGTTPHGPGPDSGTTHETNAPVHHRTTAGVKGDATEPFEKRLRSKVQRWEGTPHRLGGTSRRGIDCSGFVQMLYRDILHRSIPRSTAQQVKSGRSIPQKQLEVGDLVFFRLPYNKRHVGIYLGRSEFAHASTSKGVMISSLDAKYWRNNYWMARRYID